MKVHLLLLSLAACAGEDVGDPGPPGVGSDANDGADGMDGSTGDDGGDGTPGTDTGDSGAPFEPPPYDCTADWTALATGVGALDYGGSLSSRLVVWGERACPVVWSDDGTTLVAAATVGAGNGRVLHLGHEGQLGAGLDAGDAGLLLENALVWMVPDGNPVVGVTGERSAAAAWLEARGHTVVTAEATDLADIDVWLTTTYPDHSPEEDAAIRSWIEAGGNVVAGGHAWWWAYSTGDDDPYTNHPGNQWLGVAGLTLTGDATGSGVQPLPTEAPSPLLHAGNALEAAGAHLAENPVLAPEDAVLAATVAGYAAGVLPLASPWWQEARTVLAAAPAVVPTTAAPVSPIGQPIEALVLRLESALNQRLPADEITAFASADDFPGSVPSSAARVTQSFRLDASYAGRDARYLYSGAGAAIWRSTGLYVAPGEQVTVTVPPAAVGQGLRLSVGSHSDSLWGKEEWERSPQVVRVQEVVSEATVVASAYGGLLYLQVPPGSSIGVIDVAVEGAVQAPRFVLGETDNESWVNGLRDAPAPWAELEASSVVLTVPAAQVRTLDDPEALMTFWQAVLDSQAELAALGRDRVRAERLVTDRQISAGWMHSGYPVMAHLESAADLTSLATLTTSGDWGAFHEFGHNHQWRAWLLPGTTETTCNLWSVYNMENNVGIDRADGHSALRDASREARISTYLDGGRDFSADWSVWTALETYLQIQEAFGWQPFVEVQEQYLTDPASTDPTTDQDKIDRYFQRLSLATERDLTGFLDAWGIPLSQSVRDTVAHLPDWSDHPMQ